MASPRYDAVLFDLLTALVDSWTLWNAVAGGAEAGGTWRRAYLRRTYGAGAYRPYETLVAEAAEEVGLPSSLAARLAEHYGELRPWPEVGEVLGALRPHVKLAVVTNCSETLAHIAVACTGIAFDRVVTAEGAGFYKPHPRPYRAAITALGAPLPRCLFVAGSAFDLVGTARLGLDTYWHDRAGMTPPPEAPSPAAHHPSLQPLLAMVLGEGG
jgi:2-haloalkanoic acid dehalogenase type II